MCNIPKQGCAYREKIDFDERYSQFLLKEQDTWTSHLNRTPCINPRTRNPIDWCIDASIASSSFGLATQKKKEGITVFQVSCWFLVARKYRYGTSRKSSPAVNLLESVKCHGCIFWRALANFIRFADRLANHHGRHLHNVLRNFKINRWRYREINKLWASDARSFSSSIKIQE